MTPSDQRWCSAVPPGVLFAGVCLVTFATLLFEVALIRVLSYAIWYHFGYVVISSALLGFGISGSFLAVRPATGTRRPRAALAWAASLSAATALGMLALLVLVPLDPMAVFARPLQAAVFVGYQVGAAIPFFCSGLVVSLALRTAALRVDRLYFWDLLGAGIGCAAAVPIMDRVSPPGAIVIAAAVFVAATAVFATRVPLRLLAGALAIAGALAAPAAVRLPFTIAPSKGLALQSSYFGMQPRAMYWTSLFRTDVIENVGAEPRDPRVRDWGTSTIAPDEERPRYFFHHDGTADSGMYALGDRATLTHLDYHVLRFPYLIANPEPRVLVLGVGGGRDVVAAHQFGATDVVGVELDPIVVHLLQHELNEVAGGFFRRPDVHLIADEGRHFVRTTPARFDVIQITGVDTLSAEFSGSYVLAENYLYTVEAFRDYLTLLRPGGVLSIATGDESVEAPRAAGRMVSVAYEALRSIGVARPADHIAVIYGTFLDEILIRTAPFEPDQVARLAAESERLRFNAVLLPGREGQPAFTRLVSASAAEREGARAELPYVVSPTTDDQPFFFSFFRWRSLWSRRDLVPAHTSALGQAVLLALLGTLSLLSTALILGPLAVFRRRGILGAGREAVGLLVYFLALGAGFMLLEISLIQRFVVFLGYPTYSLSVTLASLLVSTAWGSLWSRRWVGRERVALPAALAVLAALIVFYVWGLPPLQHRLLGASLAARIATTAALLAPLGFVLGIFFPLGTRRVASIHEDLVPWAWGINGCASVTAAALAIILAMTYGFAWVWFLALLVYAAGVVALLMTERGSRSPLRAAEHR